MVVRRDVAKTAVGILLMGAVVGSLLGCSDGFLDVANPGELQARSDAGGTGPGADAGLEDTGGDDGGGFDVSEPEGCVDDEFAPGNFSIDGAAPLGAGETLEMVLCDNETEGVTSHNWFSLGTASSVSLELAWTGPEGMLRMDLWSSAGEPSERTYWVDAGTGTTSISFEGTPPAGQAVFARVFFQADRTKPELGAAYTLSRE